MKRSASANIVMHSKGDAKLVLSVAISDTANAHERLSIRLNEDEVEYHEVMDQHGTRLHVAEVGSGRLHVSYDVTVDGRHELEGCDEIDHIRYLRQSRYCESDQLGPTARDRFSDMAGEQLVLAVRDWVNKQLRYVPGSSRTADGAIQAYIARQGVCRDFAHLAIALLRSLDVPARLVSTYAPGLSPKDFHAVAEAYVDGRWLVIDPTGRAPRQSMMRIATGRDAADIAWFTAIGAPVTFGSLVVTADAEQIPADDHREVVTLGK